MKRLEARLKAIWPDAENVEKPLVFLVLWSLGRSWKRLRGLLERLGGVLMRLRGSEERLRASSERLQSVLRAS